MFDLYFVDENEHLIKELQEQLPIENNNFNVIAIHGNPYEVYRANNLCKENVVFSVPAHKYSVMPIDKNPIPSDVLEEISNKCSPYYFNKSIINDKLFAVKMSHTISSSDTWLNLFVIVGSAFKYGGMMISSNQFYNKETIIKDLMKALSGDFSGVIIGTTWSSKDSYYKNIEISGKIFDNISLDYTVFERIDLRNNSFNKINSSMPNSLFQLHLSECKMNNNRFSDSCLNLSVGDDSIVKGNVFANCKFCYLNLLFANSEVTDNNIINTKIESLTLFDKSIWANNNLSQSVINNYDRNEILSHFKMTDKGLIGYKIFNLIYSSPEVWSIKKGSIIEEQVEMNPFLTCANGINFGNEYFIKRLLKKRTPSGFGLTPFLIWEILISYKDFDKLVVPIAASVPISSSDSIPYYEVQLRAGRVKLLKSYTEKEFDKKILKIKESN